MTYEEILMNARAILSPTCKVCPECNGNACRGQIPGVGAKGKGTSFSACIEFLASVKINMDTLYHSTGQDTSISLFAETFSMPVFAAPMGGMEMNYKAVLSEGSYSDAVVTGTRRAGTFAFTADGPLDEIFVESLPVVKQADGKVVPTLKPWSNERIFAMLKELEDINAMAFAIDVDSAGLINLILHGKPVYPKSVDELREITSATKIPLIIKGIMTPNGARKALEAGAYGIVVSSHGGRTLEDAPATCAMLPSIRAAVGNNLKIFVDGGIRSGLDVFKAIALGADAALIGRPYAISVFGGGADGAELYSNKIRDELKAAMLMTGCNSLSDITADKIML